jgi:hypothetical protein
MTLGHRLVWAIVAGLVLLTGAALSPAQAPSALADLPVNTFVALEVPPRGKGIPDESKHVTWAFNPTDNRLYAVGGDYAGASYRQETWSLSLAERWANRSDRTAGWQLEYPYCGSPGQVQPKHPDFVGWTWDPKRSVFWMVPGTMVAYHENCPGETAGWKDDPGFIIGQIMTFNPRTKTWTNQAANSYTVGPHATETWMSVYDPARDEIVRFGFDGGSGGVATILDVATKRWRVVPLGLNGAGNDIRLTKEYLAPNLARREIWAIDGIAGRLHRWNMDRRSLADLGPVPGGPLESANLTYPVWDSVNGVLLWYRSTNQFYIYHPDRKRWETVQIVTSPPGLQVRGRAVVFDPSSNALLLMGGLEPPNPYMFLFRYAPGGEKR